MLERRNKKKSAKKQENWIKFVKFTHTYPEGKEKFLYFQ